MIGSSRDQFVVSLLFVGRHLLEVASNEVVKHGGQLTVVEAAVLLALRAFPGISQKEVATLVARDKTTVSRTLASLEEHGFVETRMDPVDGRRKTLDLTDSARALVAPAIESTAERLESAASGMTPEEKEAFALFIELLLSDISVA